MYLKWPSTETLAMNLIKTNKISYFENVRQKDFANNKALCNTVKSFLTS